MRRLKLLSLIFLPVKRPLICPRNVMSPQLQRHVEVEIGIYSQSNDVVEKASWIRLSNLGKLYSSTLRGHANEKTARLFCAVGCNPAQRPFPKLVASERELLNHQQGCSGLNTSYGTISCTSSFLMGFTRSSRFTPRYMAIAAATNTDEYTPRRIPIVSANAK